MSERGAMKRRVRGLLHHNWLRPLAALALAYLPVLLVCALIVLLLRPGTLQLTSTLMPLSLSDPRVLIQQLMFVLSNPSALVSPLVGWLPAALVLLAAYLFIFTPIRVSLARYFLGYLRGKNPRPVDVYDSFSGRYPRALGGMAYRFLWLALWALVLLALPITAMVNGVSFVSGLGIELAQQLYGFAAILIVSTVWCVVGLFVFINRLLAYCLTPVCLAAQPRLPARRAIWLSRRLMRGAKWQMIGLLLSFVPFFLPALLSLVLMPLLSRFGVSLGMATVLVSSLRTFLWVVVIANQLAWLYVGPYMAAGYQAFYIERKREALLDEELTAADFGAVQHGDGTMFEDTTGAMQRVDGDV